MRTKKKAIPFFSANVVTLLGEIHDSTYIRLCSKTILDDTHLQSFVPKRTFLPLVCALLQMIDIFLLGKQCTVSNVPESRIYTNKIIRHGSSITPCIRKEKDAKLFCEGNGCAYLLVVARCGRVCAPEVLWEYTCSPVGSRVE